MRAWSAFPAASNDTMSAQAVPGAIASISPARRMPSRRSAGSAKAEPRPPGGHDGGAGRGQRADLPGHGLAGSPGGRGRTYWSTGWPGRGIAAAAARMSLGVTADVVSAVVSAASMQVAVPAACPIPWAGFGPAAVAGTDPLLVARRHVDFLRIRSAI